MRSLYLANGTNEFKFADTTTEIRLNAFDDGGVATLTADAKVKIKNDTGYVLGISASITNNQAVITSGQLAQLPPGNYLLELWDTVNGGTAIYPSEGFLALQINENVAGLSGNLVSSITVDDFVQQFSELSQQLKKEASAVGWSSKITDKINNAIKGLGYIILTANDSVAPYDSLDTLPPNSIVTYGFPIKDTVKNVPIELPSVGATVITYSSSNDLVGSVQILVGQSNDFFYRIAWNRNGVTWWSNWTKNVSLEPHFFTASEIDSGSKYTDLNNLIDNQVVTYGLGNEMSKIKNAPSNDPGTLIVLNADVSNAGQAQIFVTYDNKIYRRIRWGNGQWSAWRSATDSFISKPHFFYQSEIDSGSKYTDLNNLIDNQVVTYGLGDMSKIKHAPSTSPGTLIVLNASASESGQVQIFVTYDNKIYRRVRWGGAQWGDWKNPETYKPTPSLAMFRKIGIIGDSYASGELVFDGKYVDHYEISWGQVLARKNGATAINFSNGGLTTRSWLTAEHGLSLLNSSEAQDLYICALGINDHNMGENYIGNESDIDSGTDTFYGNYGKIIKAIMSKAPNAKIVISTIAGYDSPTQKYNSAIEAISKHFGIALIKQSDDPFFTSEYYLNHMQGFHPTGPVYAEMANAIERLISQQMVENISYFETYKK